jgi:hypothetical protein
MQTNGGGPWGNHNHNINSWRRSNPLPAYSRKFTHLPEYGGFREPGAEPFFTPSYLKGSKYISQLAASHRTNKLSPQKEPTTAATAASSSNTPSLSSSSSNANLHRMAPSHRGMTYDIIENTPSRDDNSVKPLPSAWNEVDKFAGLDIVGDGVELRYSGGPTKNDQEAATARANNPMPPQCGLYYFEITVIAKPKEG